MKGKKICILGLIVAVLVVAVTVVIFMLADNGHRVIKVDSFKGDVELLRDSSGVGVFNGLNLRSEDKVTTGNASQVGLLADEDKHILAEENTQFEIVSQGNSNAGKLKIELSYGKTLIDIEKKLPDGYAFELSTPNASLSVRGTTFTVSYDPDTNTTVVNVTEGKVMIESDGGEVMVEMGHEAVITDNSLKLDGVLVSGNQTADRNIAHTDNIAFEIKHSETAELSGVCVKELIGWEYQGQSLNGVMLDELTKDGVYIRYSVVSEPKTYSDAEGDDDISYHENGKGERLRVDTIYFNGTNGDIDKSYIYYKRYHDTLADEKSYYIMIMVYDKQNGKLMGDSVYDYIDLTLNEYFDTAPHVLLDTQEQDNTDGTVEVEVEELSFECNRGTIAFEVRSLYEGDGALTSAYASLEPTRELNSEVYAYQLAGWEHTMVTENGYTYDEFVKDGIHIRYFIGIVGDMPILNAEHEMVSTSSENDDHVSIVVTTYTFSDGNKIFVLQNGNVPCYFSSSGNSLIEMTHGLLIYDDKGGDILRNYDEKDFLPLTNYQFYRWGSYYGISTRMISHTEELAFTITKVIHGDIPDIMVKNLVDWKYIDVEENGLVHNEFQKDGVHVRYALIDIDMAQELFDQYSYQELLNDKMIPVKTVTIEADERNPDRNKQYIYLKDLRYEGVGFVRDFYLAICVFDKKGSEATDAMSDINAYLDLTYDDYYFITDPRVTPTFIVS